MSHMYNTLMISWRLRRQLVAIVFATMAVSLFVGGSIYYFAIAPSCTDRKLNGTEEGVDCGGSCSPCLDTVVRDPVVLWTRFFPLGDGRYDIAAYVKNENIKSAGTLEYVLGLENAAGERFFETTARQYVRPDGVTILFAPAVDVTDVPTRAVLSLTLPSWQYAQPEQVGVVSAGYDMRFDPSPTLSVRLRNQTYVPSKKIEVTALLLNASGNVYALSRTVRDPIDGGVTDEAIFTWPSGSFDETPARVEIVILPIN